MAKKTSDWWRSLWHWRCRQPMRFLLRRAVRKVVNQWHLVSGAMLTHTVTANCWKHTVGCLFSSLNTLELVKTVLSLYTLHNLKDFWLSCCSFVCFVLISPRHVKNICEGMKERQTALRPISVGTLWLLPWGLTAEALVVMGISLLIYSDNCKSCYVKPWNISK